MVPVKSVTIKIIVLVFLPYYCNIRYADFCHMEDQSADQSVYPSFCYLKLSPEKIKNPAVVDKVFFFTRT